MSMTCFGQNEYAVRRPKK